MSVDKKKVWGIGGLLTGLAAVIAVAANISEVVQLFRGDDQLKETVPVTSVAETTIEQTTAVETIIVTVPYVVEEVAVEQTETVEENIIVTEAVTETVLPTEPLTEPSTKLKPVSVYINDLQYMSCENSIENQRTLTDNIGNTYHTGLIMYYYLYGAGGGSANYYIQGKYTTFSGTVAVASGYENDTSSACFEVYGDGNLLYTSPLMTNTSFPENFSIDITDV